MWNSLTKRLGLHTRTKRRPRPSLRDRYPQYVIGKHTYGDLHVSQWGEGESLTIGAFCSIAEGVRIYLGGEHRIDWVTTFPFNVLWESAASFTGHPASKGKVVVGNDVWIGAEALILSGVTIGDGAVIGARAVVTKEIPAYAIAVGNPATVVRRRFDADTIEALLRIRWWDWDDARIQRALPLLLSGNVAAFLQAVQAGNL
jgi:chloramphenicol O-acetyltransferase type B